MKASICLMILFGVTVLFELPATADFYSGYAGFSEAFDRDVRAAAVACDQKKSVDPLVALLKQYASPAEQAELEVQIGVCYGQRTGMLNPSNAVVHFTSALEHGLPDRGRNQVLMWRGNALEQLKKEDAALKDYLRGLLACSYYDLPAVWPEILSPKVPIFLNSPDPENSQRARDYNEYRRQLDFEQFLIMQRYYLIEAVKRVRHGRTDSELARMLDAISPDSKRCDAVIAQANSENKRPWP